MSSDVRTRKARLIQSAVPLAGLFLAAACPSLDGFTGKTADAGTHEAGPPDSGPPGGGFLSLSQAAQVCSSVFKCPYLQSTISGSLLIAVDTNSYSECVNDLAGPLPSNHFGTEAQAKQLQCVANATNCADASSCLGIEEMAPADPRCNSLEAGTSVGCSPDGRSVYYCDTHYVLHCDNAYYHSGTTCLPAILDGGVEYWCALSQTCSGFASCAGSMLTYCGSNGQTFSVDCALKGATCGKDKVSGLTDCIVGDTSPICTFRSTVCKGDKVSVCDGYNYSEMDCANLAGTCDAQPGPHCVGYFDACTQSDPNLNTCDGNTISLCIGGTPQTFDCSSVNLKCLPGSGASAYCG